MSHLHFESTADALQSYTAGILAGSIRPTARDFDMWVRTSTLSHAHRRMVSVANAVAVTVREREHGEGFGGTNGKTEGTMKSNPDFTIVKEVLHPSKLFIIQTVKSSLGMNPGQFTELDWCVNPQGILIGDNKDAEYKCVQRGIIPQTKKDDSRVCSVGYSPKDGKWYGWSHRAIFGFAPGDVIDDPDHICHHEGVPVGYKAEHYQDAFFLACKFADGVA